MALPFEALAQAARTAAIDREKRNLVGADRSSAVTRLLAEAAEASLDLQAVIENATVAAAGITAANVDDQRAATLASLRQAHPAVAEIAGRLLMAARFDCASVMDVVSTADTIPGMTAAQVKAIRAKY